MTGAEIEIRRFRAKIEKQDIVQRMIREHERFLEKQENLSPELRAEAERNLEEARRILAYKAFPASAIGCAFHNPYTFIPFPVTAPERHAPTPLTIDEVEKDRLTGVLNIKLKNLSPLCTVQAEEKGKDKQKALLLPQKALKIGNDVIVPASSVRGSLRSLMAIISGSALDYVDENLWLCQGRDLRLNKEALYLAEIIDAKSMLVRVGKAELVQTGSLLECLESNIYNYKKDFHRKLEKYTQTDGKNELWIDAVSKPSSISNKYDSQHPWRVKVSGPKVVRGIPHEGAFRPEDGCQKMFLSDSLKADFECRNRNGVKKSLQNGDLVWLEPVDPEIGINTADDVKSIQWARWGRHGVNFVEKLKVKNKHMLPDYLRNDGMVDIVSDLFGAIPLEQSDDHAFVARIRPGNLVFKNGKTFSNFMPFSGSPHPGCIAFYLKNSSCEKISIADEFRGYKVYRTTSERDNEAPWLYQVQPIYEVKDRVKPEKEVMDKTSQKDLLEVGQDGSLQIAFRGLSRKEFALLLLTLSCDLRFGGGKPFGLGHCIVSEISAVNEFGETILPSWKPEKRAEVPDEFQKEAAVFCKRAELYCKTQIPVEKLRYPRAYENSQHGGMCWFKMFATPQKGKPGLEKKTPPNLPSVAQVLPIFDPADPQADVLFGYDTRLVKDGKNIKECFPEGPSAEEFVRNRNTSQNRESRQAERNRR